MRSPPRPPPARSATTSPWTRHLAGGTWTPAGRPPPGPRPRWGNCGATRWWPSTSTPATSPSPSSRPTGTSLGAPFTVPLDLAGLPAATRDGRLRAAISGLIATAREHGARAIVVEDLDFTEARAEGRERHGNRPSRGTRGRGVPPRGRRHPDREVPRPAGADDRQRRAARHRRRPRLHLTVGSRALARPAARAPPRGDRAPRGSAGARATRARPPGQAPRDREPPAPEDAARPAQARPRKTRRPGPHPGSPSPHEAPGSHPAPRPGSLTGPRQATRQPRTVRGRRIPRTISCDLD